MSAPPKIATENRANKTTQGVHWRLDDQAVDYQTAVDWMTQRASAIYEGSAPETVWLLEHPPLYTAGTSARDGDLLTPDRFPVYHSGRGGQYTYHGPGQRIAYVMLDLNQRGRDIRKLVTDLEDWLIQTLASFNIKGERRQGRVGIWVDRSRELGPGREDKIAAIGVRIKRWVTLHGVALNVDPDLSHFQGIVPCGIGDDRLGVTSLTDLGIPVSIPEVDSALKTAFDAVFNP